MSPSKCHIAFWEVQFSKNPCFPDKARVLLVLLWLGCIPYHSVTRLPTNIILVGGGEGTQTNSAPGRNYKYSYASTAFVFGVFYLDFYSHSQQNQIRNSASRPGTGNSIQYQRLRRTCLLWHNLKQNNVKAIYEATRFF